MVTLKDIATEAGVSVMTVSNVINGNHHKVSEKNRERIWEIIRKYNYIPNQSARSLAGKASNMISLIIPAYHSGTNFQNPYNSVITGMVEHVANQLGYYVMVHSIEQYVELVNATRKWNVDGAILHGIFEDELRHVQKEKSPIPMVVLDSYIPSQKLLSVRIDDFKGGYLATRYLLSRGHRDIAFASYAFSPERPGVISNRYKGYVTALKEAGLPLRPDFRIGIEESNYQAGIKAGQAIGSMLSRPTAVVIPADISAIGVMEGARLAGLHVPADLSIVGFDDLECAQYCSPKLTTIRQDIIGKAQKAVSMLVSRIENGPGKTTEIVMDVSLVERQSVRQLP